MAENPIGEHRLASLRHRWDLDRTSRLFVQLAEAHRRRGEMNEALTVLEEGLSHHPNYLSARIVKARCQLGMGQPEIALQVLESVVSRDPTHLVAGQLLVESHLQLGDQESALEALERYRLLGAGGIEFDELQHRARAIERSPGVEVADQGDSVDPGPPIAPLAEAEAPTQKVAPLSSPLGGSTNQEAVPTKPEIGLASTANSSGPQPVSFDLGPTENAPLTLPATPTRRKARSLRLVTGGAPFGALPMLKVQIPQTAEDPIRMPEAAPVGPVEASEGLSIADSPLVAANDEGAETETEEPPDSLQSLGVVSSSEDVPTPSNPLGPPVLESSAPLPSSGVDDLLQHDATPVLTESDPLEEGHPNPEEAAAVHRINEATQSEETEAHPKVETDSKEVQVAPRDSDKDVESAGGSDSDISSVGDPADVEELVSTTLGELYREQGHTEEAEEVFRQVLEKHPDDRGAVAGLAAIDDLEICEPMDEDRELTAEDLLGEEAIQERGLTARKLFLLQQYLARIQRRGE